MDDDMKQLLDAATWIVRLFGTEDPTGLQELREEVTKMRAVLPSVRLKFPEYDAPKISA